MNETTENATSGEPSRLDHRVRLLKGLSKLGVGTHGSDIEQEPSIASLSSRSPLVTKGAYWNHVVPRRKTP